MKTLVALDCSEASFNALECACRMARKTGAYVTAFHVNTGEEYTPEETGWASIQEKIQQELERRGQEVIRRARAMGRELGVEVEGIIVHGLPAAEIGRYCAAHGIVKLVATGHSSKGGGTQGFVGSTTRGILSAVTGAAVLVTSKPGEIARILVAVDGSEASERVTVAAGRMAKALAAEVRVVSVFPDHDALLSEYRQIAEVPNVERHLKESEERLRERAFRAVEEASASLASLGLNVSAMVRHGRVAEMLLEESRNADLTVVSTETGRDQRRIGPIVGKLLAHSEVSLLCLQ